MRQWLSVTLAPIRAPGTDDDPVLDHGIGADPAIIADLDAGADDDMGGDLASFADPRRGVDQRRRGDAGVQRRPG